MIIISYIIIIYIHINVVYILSWTQKILIMGHHLDGMSLFEIITTIDNMTVQVQTVYNEYEKNKRESARHKTSVNRLNMEIQKQSYLLRFDNKTIFRNMLIFICVPNIVLTFLAVFNKKLMDKKCNISKTKKEYEDELKTNKHIRSRMKSTIDTQFEEIQRILGKL